MLGLFKLLLYLSVGEIFVRVMHLPLPGSVLGLLLMLTDFRLNGRVDREVERLFDSVSSHFSILFVPAGAGIIVQGEVLADGISVIVISVLAGTLATLFVTAFSFRLFLLRKCTAPPEEGNGAETNERGSQS